MRDNPSWRQEGAPSETDPDQRGPAIRRYGLSGPAAKTTIGNEFIVVISDQYMRLTQAISSSKNQFPIDFVDPPRPLDPNIRDYELSVHRQFPQVCEQVLQKVKSVRCDESPHSHLITHGKNRQAEL